MRIGLLSDTHGFLDEAIFSWFAQCDEIWHAGDIGSLEILERLHTFKPTRAVFGNIDPPEVSGHVPADMDWECESVRVYMTHIGGRPGKYVKNVKQELLRRKPNLFVSGHSHVLLVARDADLGLFHMNPGACGHQGWHKMRTLLRFRVDGQNIEDVEAIELGPRGKR